MKQALGAFLLLGVPGFLCAQTSAYQSADGNTSIFLGNAKGSTIFNVSNSQFDLGYLHEGTGRTSAAAKRWGAFMYGFDVSGKPSSDFSTLFEKGKTPPSAGGTASFGYHAPFAKFLTRQVQDRTSGHPDHLRDDYLLLKLTYTRSAFETVAGAASEPVKRTFDGYSALLAYDAHLNLDGSAGGTVFLGAASGVQRENNLSNLQSVTITTPVLTSATGIAPFTVTRQVSGYFGDYLRSFGAPIYTDAIWIPSRLKSVIAVDAFTRSDAAHENRYFESGVGVYIANPSDVSKVTGGVSLGWKNGTPTLSFVTGWSF